MRCPFAASFCLALVAQASGALAAITSHDTLFTSTCIDMQATAFAWQDGKWALIPFFPNKYTLVKHAADSPGCADLLAPKSALSTTFDNITYACYTIADFGKDTSPPEVCVEWWSTDDSSAVLQNVTCAGDAPFEWIVFDPAGNFQYAQLDADLSDAPADGTKDPLVLSVGACKITRQR